MRTLFMDTRSIAPDDFETGRIIINNNLVGGVLSKGSAGEIPYQSGSDKTEFIPAGTSGQILSSNGTSAPSWINQSSIIAGSALHILAPPPAYTSYSTPGSGTHFLSPNCTYFEVWVTGGGGGGGNSGSGAINPSNGGGGGGTAYGSFTSFASTSYSYTVGSGGAVSTDGTNSTFTNVGNTILMVGYHGKKGDDRSASGGEGGSYLVLGATHIHGFQGGDGFFSQALTMGVSNQGGASYWTGAGRGVGEKGSGGGGSTSGGTGQAGGNGFILIKEHFY